MHPGTVVGVLDQLQKKGEISISRDVDADDLFRLVSSNAAGTLLIERFRSMLEHGDVKHDKKACLRDMVRLNSWKTGLDAKIHARLDKLYRAQSSNKDVVTRDILEDLFDLSTKHGVGRALEVVDSMEKMLSQKELRKGIRSVVVKAAHPPPSDDVGGDDDDDGDDDDGGGGGDDEFARKLKRFSQKFGVVVDLDAMDAVNRVHEIDPSQAVALVAEGISRQRLRNPNAFLMSRAKMTMQRLTEEGVRRKRRRSSENAHFFDTIRRLEAATNKAVDGAAMALARGMFDADPLMLEKIVYEVPDHCDPSEYLTSRIQTIKERSTTRADKSFEYGGDHREEDDEEEEVEEVEEGGDKNNDDKYYY